MEKVKSEQISGVVVKKARKYFHVHLDTHHQPDFTQKLLICDEINDLKEGDRFENLNVRVEWAYGYTTGKPYVDYYVVCTEADKEAERKADIAKWWGYVLEAYDNGKGHIYERGVAELNRLNATEELSRLPEMRSAIAAHDRKEKIAKWWGYILDAYNDGEGYIYEKGVGVLSKLGAQEYLEKIPEMRKKVLETQLANSSKPSKLKSLVFSAEEGRYISSGMLIERNGSVFRAGQKHYHKEDGFSFGAMSEEWYSVDVQDITDTPEGKAEKERVDKEKVAAAERREKAELVKDAKQRIIKAVKSGERIPETSLIDLEAGKTVVWDTINIYGGGDVLLVDDDKAYYIINNGTDGGDWSVNNIRTGGAGAFGFYCPLTPELLADIEIIKK